MMKTPPERSGITFKVGAQLQARDCQKNWYSATIEKIDYEEEKVLVHFKQWSRRHNEWIHWSSSCLRPLERISLRRQGLKSSRSSPVFVSGTKVLACWTDCRFYPAKIIRVNKEDSYTVRFYDGVVRNVKAAKIKPFPKRSKREKKAVGSEGWEEGESEEEDGDKREKEKEEQGEKVSTEVKKESADSESVEANNHTSLCLPSPGPNEESRKTETLDEPGTASSIQPALSIPPHVDKDILLERQSHLPTTHKYSREPLYRVIKNQPPPILSIDLDHNPFKCTSVGCTKSFRKASLLHYHMKYYHSDQLQDKRSSGQGTLRRKRSSSEGCEYLLERKMNAQASTFHHDDREHSIVETVPPPCPKSEVKKEEAREKPYGNDRKEKKNFLRVKLKKKKKKKKKSHSGLCSSDDELLDHPRIMLKLSPEHPNIFTQAADDGSDWSTLTAESGEDTTSWPVAMETEECEVVRCVCEVDEENDFMIQCESCLCWQHGTCMGLYEDNVPHNYICYYCRHTAGWRRKQHYLPQPDLLTSGHMFGLSCVKENYSIANASKILHTSGLLAHTYGLHQVLSGLQLKISLLHSASHPDLRLWRFPWRWLDEEPLKTEDSREDSSVSYVSSEHCYQKPGALRAKSEPEEKECSKPEIKPEQKEIKQEDTDSDAAVAPENCYLGERRQLSVKSTDVNEEHALSLSTTSTIGCQLNLCEHVESLHQQINDRMDLIEKELDVLESWLDHSGELEPPDPLSRLPQLKQRIRRLLHDLCTVRLLSVQH
ncbi:PHD finger protein 20-like isoform X3 [Synchiropus splendidus]|uniref:PHD finger protein 20-like isoform X3 n=1 Tax=Synchiropus splendidus TaxID=270530 RepID=UPI00237E609D|nr:PHD finger protein 20-like isoform X3 [Synchiropus splendidus]